MSYHTTVGASALSRLRSRLDRTELVCPECAYEDADGAWDAETSGARVRYRHQCPSCGAVRVRVIRLGRDQS